MSHKKICIFMCEQDYKNKKLVITTGPYASEKTLQDPQVSYKIFQGFQGSFKDSWKNIRNTLQRSDMKYQIGKDPPRLIFEDPQRLSKILSIRRMKMFKDPDVHDFYRSLRILAITLFLSLCLRSLKILEDYLKRKKR